TRNIVIWSWWFAVVLTLAADTAAFYFVQDGLIDSELASMIGKFLVLLALVWLILAIVLLVLPWRKWFGWNEKLLSSSTSTSEIENNLQPLNTPLELGEKGWFTFGRPEALILFSAIALSLHGIALTFAQNRSLATFALLVLALVWTLLATTRLQAALTANQRIKEKDIEAGLEELGDIRYSDGGDSFLLEDENTGLRGRPDQITRIGEDLIPVELKTGKIPKKPHKSHRFQILAYLHLIESMTGNPPPFGFLRYGTESVYSIEWNEKEKEKLFDIIKEIQRVTVQGGAKRDHNRPGKCESCSRREDCPDRLKFIPNQ
ncbi:MAG: Dna2/Cas4 domain-containing protein, partial [Candidatus Thermoplasmatota archaeon]|nr:Dna2/Cas4 domain-containing protein [Candidatus Thermoplasmatota archaeon]